MTKELDEISAQVAAELTKLVKILGRANVLKATRRWVRLETERDKLDRENKKLQARLDENEKARKQLK